MKNWWNGNGLDTLQEDKTTDGVQTLYSCIPEKSPKGHHRVKWSEEIRKVTSFNRMTKALHKKQSENLGETYIQQRIENGCWWWYPFVLPYSYITDLSR